MPIRPLLCVCTIALLVPCLADQQVLSTGSSLDVLVRSDEPLLPSQTGPMVRGALQLSPHPIRPVCDRVVFYVDDEVLLATDAKGPVLLLDTTTLGDGEHSIRIEAERDGKLAMSSGTIALVVANKEGAAVLQEAAHAPVGPSPEFAKLYRVIIPSEAIWFDGEEGDLERHATVAGGRMYITLTDLLRHIGGRLVWGPTAASITVQRGPKTVKIVPGSSTAIVNGKAVSMGRPAVMRSNRTFVPVRAMCNIFGIYIEWSDKDRRAYVYAPQPGYGVEVATYPWISAVTGDRLSTAPGSLSFRNLTGRPIHVLLQGNGFRADWHIPGRATLPAAYIAPGTYQMTVWSADAEDINEYITVAAGMSDRYDIAITSGSIARIRN